MNCPLDTNLLPRAADAAAAQHAVATGAINTLLARGDHLSIAPQNIYEFWVVVTRPPADNGFGWTPTRATAAVHGLLTQFALLDDGPDLFAQWMRLVQTYGVSGKKAHDTRLVAAAIAHGVTHILTFNGPDFARFAPEITIIDPRSVAAPAAPGTP